jgi:quercetin dioxygenase-like cupin family protein
MFRQRLRSIALVVVLFTLLGSLAPALAQDGTPAATPAVAGPGEVDLAAMALTVDDLPPGYRLDRGRYTPAAMIPQIIPVTADEVAATGVIRIYEAFFYLPGTPEGIRLYINHYPTVEAAEAGFALFEDETVAPDEPFPPLASVDLPGPGFGAPPSEITAQTWPDTPGRVYQEIDATIRVGTIGAGVGVGGPLEATGDEAPAPDPERLRLATELAGVLHDRISAVLAGQSPAGSDLALPSLLLPIQGTGSGLIEEYVSPAQGLRGSVDTPPAAMFTSAYFRATATGPLRPMGSNLPPDWVQGPPHVNIGVADFADAQAAASALDLVRSGPAFFVTEGPREFVADPVVPDADAAVAYRTTNLPLPGTDPDTFGVAFTVGDRLAVVEVLGSPEAERLALDLAARQAACLAGTECEPVDLTGSMIAATPGASAMATPGAGEAVTQTLMAATVEVPEAEHYVDLFRVDYAPGATEESHAATGPALDMVVAGSLTITVEGPAMVTRAADPATSEAVAPGTEVTLDAGDGLMIPAGTAHTNRNAGEGPAVLLAAVFLPVDADAPPPAAGVTLLWLASGPSAAAGPNAVSLDRVTLGPGAAIPPPLLYTVASGSAEVTEDGGLQNTGPTTMELVTLTYEPAPIPEEAADSEDGSTGTPSATPAP